ncbi:AprI/Inh family metalloprotease inhibitor [Daeguia caeni]|uniref:AprI/Inh family metalloprotease inhibitor n=1 Tax=Daeguia caeni TaxID=439612 RepID=A0ABV9H482_9HYPH
MKPFNQFLSVSLFAIVMAMPVFAAEPVDPDIRKAAGRYDLWEDYEGGTVCTINLTTKRTIGGYVIDGKEDCFARLALDGDPFAWFLTDAGDVVIIDATRKRLVTLEHHKDREYYAVRQNEGRANLNLTPPTP